MIEKVILKELKMIVDERGRVMEVLRADENIFLKFGQVYMTTTRPGVIKAWHLHKLQVDNITCLAGELKLVLYDVREGSSTYHQLEEIFLGEYRPLLVQIPPFIYHGWKCISPQEAIVINIPTLPYNHKEPDEYRLPYDTPQIPYSWEIKMG
jgi:dTDP-4-dehydrorhamnose 3,5-epimerase